MSNGLAWEIRPYTGGNHTARAEKCLSNLQEADSFKGGVGTWQADADNDINSEGSASTASSWHSGGVNVLLCDGSTRFVQDRISLVVWRAIGGRNDGQSVTLSP